MTMQLRWKASFSASCLHAAACMHEGLPISENTIAQVLQPAVDALVGELQAGGFAVDRALPQLTCLAADFENNRELVQMAAKRLQGANALGDASISRLAGCLADLEAAWLREQPDLVEELAVRGRPLREQWEARGPGLLHAVKKLTNDDFVAYEAEVVLVSPVVGGHGRAHLLNNRVTFEAVLANPHPELPETLRLGWLLSQLNLDVPVLSEPVPQHQLPKLANLATLPLILEAAETVELAQLSEAALAQSLECWHITSQTDDLPRILLDWWQAYRSSETRWPVAMSALQQMLGG